MRDQSMEKRAIRTVRRKKRKDLLAVLSFLLLLPYTCGMLAVQSGALEKAGGQAHDGMAGQNVAEAAAGLSPAAVETMSTGYGGEFVLWEQENGMRRIPLEEFLVGALAASLPPAYREETRKAQAVILRSICLLEMQESGELRREDTALACLEQSARQALWGEDFAENEANYKKAVEETKGIVLTYEGNVVSPPFFRMSCGRTRSGAEIFGTERIVWCHSVECPHNLEAEDFLQEKRLGHNDFVDCLKEAGMVLPAKGAKIVITRDSAGYVLRVRCGEYEMEGERFRKLFALPSSCFYLKEEKGEVILQTKGIGHGLGFDQYGADLLAEEGKDYQELLHTFFAGLSLEKIR